MAGRQQQKIQYEDFVPNSELQDQPDASILLIHLPGFTREQIRVAYVHATRTLRVNGERPSEGAADKRWSRFNMAFPVPENCRVDKIQGSFKNGVLSITMPKQTVSKAAEGSRTEKEVKLPDDSKALEPPKEERKGEKPEEKKVPEESRGRERLGRLEERKLAEESKTEEKKLLEESRGKERPWRLEEKKLLEESKPKGKKLGEEPRGKERIGATEERKLAEEEEKRVKREKEKQLLEESRGKERETKLVQEVTDKERGGGYLVGKEKKGKGIMEKIWAKEMTSEDKKLMVNMGVAALVIFALGAYVSYTFSSSSSSSSSSSPSSSSSSSKPE